MRGLRCRNARSLSSVPLATAGGSAGRTASCTSCVSQPERRVWENIYIALYSVTWGKNKVHVLLKMTHNTAVQFQTKSPDVFVVQLLWA